VVTVTLKRVVVNLDEELVKEIDEYAAANRINRTSAISIITSMFLKGIKANDEMKKLNDMIMALNEKVIQK
jgi:metal-responsive CopG/Arc/MetJ family transcriptional regulator